jgi:hypothetical protein
MVETWYCKSTRRRQQSERKRNGNVRTVQGLLWRPIDKRSERELQNVSVGRNSLDIACAVKYRCLPFGREKMIEVKTQRDALMEGGDKRRAS